MRTALAALIRDRHGQAAQLGTGYYQQARRAAGILSEAPRIAVPPLPEPQITATLDSMGPWNLLGKIKQGQQVATANENTGVQLAGAAQRLITNGARQAVLQSVEADAESRGVDAGDELESVRVLRDAIQPEFRLPERGFCVV